MNQRMPDPLALTIAKGAGDALAEPAKTFAGGLAELVHRRYGPAADVKARVAAVKAAIAGARELEEFAAEYGFKLQTPPNRLLEPIVEGMRREEDGELASAWSALLANACVTEAGTAVVPSFPRILERLAPLDARVLAFLAARVDDEEPDFWTSNRRHVDDELIVQALGITSRADYELAVANLTGVGVLQIPGAVQISDGNIGFVLGAVMITRLGWAFVLACQPPLAPNSK